MPEFVEPFSEKVRYTNERRIMCICRECDYDWVLYGRAARRGSAHHVAW